MLIRVIDFETTGMPPDAAVCEVGWTDVVGTTADSTTGLQQWTVGLPTATLCDPKRPMPPEARAVHHLSDFDVMGEGSAAVAFMYLTDSANIFAAHNAAFEQEFFMGGGRPWICTMKCARRLWPDLPSFGNQFLRYHLGFELPDELAMPPHRAGPDTYVTAHILTEQLKLADVDQLVAWSKMPLYYPRVPMTAHKGKLWSEVEYGLLTWFTKQDFVDADIKAAARDEIKRRDNERRP